MIDPLQTLTATVDHARGRVICHRADDAGAFCQKLRHTPDLTGAACQGDAVFGNIADQLCSSILQHGQYFIGNDLGRTAEHLKQL